MICRKKAYNAVMGFAFLCCLGYSAVNAQTTPSYQVKAAFLYNFSQFIEWPRQAFSSPNSPFVIGVLGTDPFGSYLDQLVKGEKAGKHPIIVRRFKDVKEVGNCHIIFVNVGNTKEITETLANRNILTVGDTEDFARKGGMIRFFTENNKIRLQVNTDNIKVANLAISAKLLRVSDIIQN